MKNTKIRRRVLLGVLVALLPIVALRSWASIEVDALRREIERRAPVDVRDPYVVRAIPTRYYKAAASLTSLPLGFTPMLGLNVGVDRVLALDIGADHAASGRTMNAAFYVRLDDVVRVNREALRLLAAANFGDVMRPGAPGFDVGISEPDIDTLLQLATASFLYYASNRDWNAATDAALNSMALLPLFEAVRNSQGGTFRRYGALWERTWEIARLIESHSLEAVQLDALERALVPLVRDGDLHRSYLAVTGRYVDSMVQPQLRAGIRAFLVDPMWARRAAADLRVIRGIDAAFLEPWPERLDAARNVGLPPGRSEWISESMELTAMRFADGTALQRAALIAIGVERFRRATGRLPATLDTIVPNYLTELLRDPYTGEALRYRVSATGYIVYSAGPNRADDGGALREFGQRFWMEKRKVGDIGLRIRTGA